MEANGPPKKKRRTPLSCVTCRQKKVKCDRTKPKCLRCINSNCECVYDSPMLWSDISEESLHLSTINNNNALSFVSSLGKPNQSNSEKYYPPKPSTILNQDILDFDGTLNIDVKNQNGKTKTEISDFKALNNQSHQMKLTVPLNQLHLPLPTSIQDRLFEIEFLKKRIHMLENNYDDPIECISLVLDNNNKSRAVFRSKKDTRFLQLGTFINSGIWKVDPVLSNFFKKFFLLKTWKKSANNIPIIQKYFLLTCSKTNEKFVPSMKSFEFLNAQLTIKKKKIKLVDSNYFIQKVEETLPPWDVIQFHIERFIKYFYSFVPVIDEHIFMANISTILTYPNQKETTDNNTGVKICFSTKLDTIRLSILLLVLRISYLSLYLELQMTDQTPSVPQQRVLTFPIGSDIIHLIHYALNDANFLRKTSIETYQLLLLYRFYHFKACEDGDGYLGSDGVIFASLLAGNSKTLGLDKGFDENIILNFKHAKELKNWRAEIGTNGQLLDFNKLISPNLKMNLLMKGPASFNQLWRKLWWTGLSLDLYHGMMYGIVPQFDHSHDSFQTGLINFNAECSNVQTLELEHFTTDSINQFANVNEKIYELLKKLHSFKTKPTVVEVESKMEELVAITEKTFNNANCGTYIFAPLHVAVEVNNIRSKMEIYGFLLFIQINLLLHCEQLARREKDGYMSKSLGYSHIRFAKIFPNFFLNWTFLIETAITVWKKISGKSVASISNISDPSTAEYSPYIFILAPVINIIFAKLICGLFYISIRLLIFTHQLKQNKIIYEKTDENSSKIAELLKFYSNLIILIKSLIVIEGNLSRYWYPSLRMYTMFRSLFDWIENEDFPPNFLSDPNIFSGNETADPNSGEVNSTIHETIDISNMFLLSLTLQDIVTINHNIERIKSMHGLHNINVAYTAVLNNLNCAQNANKESTLNIATSDIENLTPLSNNSDASKQKNDLDSHITPTNNDLMHMFESLRADDWDDISKWFTNGDFFDSVGMDPTREFGL